MRILKRDIRRGTHFVKIKNFTNGWTIVGKEIGYCTGTLLRFFYYDDRAWFELKIVDKPTTTINLQRHFNDWQNPTQEENILWTLETGLEPIETYVEQMEKMMENFK